MDYLSFQTIVRARGIELYRDMPWRRDTQAYFVLVSELMLQQTQVPRVMPKFEEFTHLFPGIGALAQAPLSDVLAAWSGLGYNRRAKYLHQAAKRLVEEHGGEMPKTFSELQSLPGIGPATAGAIMVYAYNQPLVFIETNVRTVYFYHFFPSGEKVSDKQLEPIIEATIDKENPREFYWALMDYGTALKKTVGRATGTQSLHYKKQATFAGSDRQVRGQIVRVLSGNDMTLLDLRAAVSADERFERALQSLIKDGLVSATGTDYHLTK